MEIWSKAQAWKTQPAERFIPIDTSGHKITLRRRWFHLRNCCTFSTFLPKHFPADQPWNFLTIGVFEGAQEVWLMQNILRHPQSRLVSIDPWEATSKLDQKFMDEAYTNAVGNLFPWRNQVTLVKGYSQDVLKQAIDDHGLMGIKEFDLLIIDGDHNAEPVYQDAVLCWQLASKGAWLLFDDVRNRVPKKHHVKEGLEKFLADSRYPVEFEWAHRFCDCYSKKG